MNFIAFVFSSIVITMVTCANADDDKKAPEEPQVRRGCLNRLLSPDHECEICQRYQEPCNHDWQWIGHFSPTPKDKACADCHQKYNSKKEKVNICTKCRAVHHVSQETCDTLSQFQDRYGSKAKCPSSETCDYCIAKTGPDYADFGFWSKGEDNKEPCGQHIWWTFPLYGLFRWGADRLCEVCHKAIHRNRRIDHRPDQCKRCGLVKHFTPTDCDADFEEGVRRAEEDERKNSKGPAKDDDDAKAPSVNDPRPQPHPQAPMPQPPKRRGRQNPSQNRSPQNPSNDGGHQDQASPGPSGFPKESKPKSTASLLRNLLKSDAPQPPPPRLFDTDEP